MFCLFYQWFSFVYLIETTTKKNSSNPKKRYELFLKATQLDIIIEKLDECTHAIEKGKAYYRSHQIACQALQEKKTEIDKKVSQFQSMEPLKVFRKILK